MSNVREIVFGVTGSIAAYKACEIVNKLKKDGFNVTVVMTKEATKFIAPLTLQTLSKNQVITDMFAPPVEWIPVHISLAEKADLILIAPATANIIGKVANGICDDILSCIILSSSSTVLLAPAMNQQMYQNKIVQENIKKLKRLKYKFIPPIEGHLACGYEGIGHLAQVDTIVREVKKILK